MSNLLLHVCCGPCATYVVGRLREQGHKVTACWYNPNIHPCHEHQRRLEAMEALSQAVDLPLIVEPGYDLIAYFRAVVGHEADRCPHCYRLRLEAVATLARDRGFQAFTTTLLISPYQQHDVLRQVGEALAEENGVQFHYEDFRPGFRESHCLAGDLGLYRQPYCGCVYSEWERHARFKIGS
ncbi:epoxyqueuosine reductase QueH [Chloroflexota bacterium]